MTDPRLPVVLLWHMHQPPYRDALSGRYVLPWTYLHAIKDYTDMAAHLEEVPGAKAVVNFTPVLIEQIEDLTACWRRSIPRPCRRIRQRACCCCAPACAPTART
jgi:alpha-amylase/alpha-mannosidase (GH57 family)